MADHHASNGSAKKGKGSNKGRPGEGKERKRGEGRKRGKERKRDKVESTLRGLIRKRKADEPEEYEIRKLRKPDEETPPFKPQSPNPGIVIRRRENAPHDWDPNDTDIHEDDIEAMIQRCNDRIRDGIMPQWWEEKLEQYEKQQKALHNLMLSETVGLSLEVVIRLKRLETVKNCLLQTDDKYNAIPNIDAIMNDYRMGGYVWEYGKVTYWSNGTFLRGPKKFDVDEFLLLHSEHDGPNGFWAEVHDTPGAFSISPAIGHTIRQGNDPAYPGFCSYILQFKRPGSVGIPSTARGINLSVIDDTGSAVIVIYEDDLALISRNERGVIPMLYQTVIRGIGNAPVRSYGVILEVAYVIPPNTVATEFARWPVWVLEGPRAGKERIGGPYLRRMFYVGSAPQNPYRLGVASNAGKLAELLPNRDQADTTADEFEMPIVNPDALLPEWAMNRDILYIATPALPGPLQAPLPGGRGPFPGGGGA